MNDATRKGASADADAAELENGKEGVDNEAGKQDDPTLPSEHPTRKRADVYDRFAAHRAETEAENDADENEIIARGGSVEAMHEEGDEGEESESTDEQDNDPLADLIVMQDDKPFIKLVVDGKEKLLTPERARAQLQKHEAADLRLQRASETLRSLEERENALKEKEASHERSPSGKDVSAEDDAAIEAEAAGLLESLLDEDEETAKQKLTAFLKKATTRSEPIDEDALVERIVTRSTQRNAEVTQEQLLADGYNAYLREYGDTPVENDPALRAWHAAKVDELAAEHSDWTPGQCMLKAGEMACEFAGIEAPTASETITEEQVVEEETTEKPTPRQQRKQELQPLPDTHSAQVRVKPEEQEVQTPRGYVAEMRARRGQAANAG